MARVDTLTNFLTDVADSIRSKTGKTDTISCSDFDTEIESISTGSSTPDYGFAPTEWDSGGRIIKGVYYGNSVPKYYLSGSANTTHIFYGLDLSFNESSLSGLGDYSFYNNPLNSIEIPEITGEPTSGYGIGLHTFDGCKYLKKIEFLGNVSGFRAASNSTCSDSVSYTFQNCSSLEEIVNFPQISNFYAYMFSGCSSLSTIDISNATVIGDYCFHNCSNLTFDSLPETLATIYKYVFYNCTSLSLTSLPSSITSIGFSAFRGCSGLKTLVIPSNCTIGGSSSSNGAFYNCSNLTQVTLGASGVPYTQSNAGKYTFYNCSSLEKIIMYTSDGTGTSNYFYKTSTSTYHTIEFKTA